MEARKPDPSSKSEKAKKSTEELQNEVQKLRYLVGGLTFATFAGMCLFSQGSKNAAKAVKAANEAASEAILAPYFQHTHSRPQPYDTPSMPRAYEILYELRHSG